MQFEMDHFNYRVTDMAKSVAFYQKALGMQVIREMGSPDGPVHFTIMGYEGQRALLELMWVKDHSGPYDTGDRTYHFCVLTEDMEEALALHRSMGCIHEERPGGMCHFIEDPDGYLVEIMKKH